MGRVFDVAYTPTADFVLSASDDGNVRYVLNSPSPMLSLRGWIFLLTLDVGYGNPTLPRKSAQYPPKNVNLSNTVQNSSRNGQPPKTSDQSLNADSSRLVSTIRRKRRGIWLRLRKSKRIDGGNIRGLVRKSQRQRERVSRSLCFYQCSKIPFKFDLRSGGPERLDWVSETVYLECR